MLVDIEKLKSEVPELEDFNIKRGTDYDSAASDVYPPSEEKPFAFRATPGAKVGTSEIYFGKLLTTVTIINFERKYVDGQWLNVLESQDPIPAIATHIPDNLRNDFGYLRSTTLNWLGNIYLYWETDELGVVTHCDIRGPVAPIGVPISKLENDLERIGYKVGKYYVLLATTATGSGVNVTQHISSDVTWAVTIIPEGNGDSSSDESSSFGSDSGSDKSTAIVRASWTDTGYTALFVEESPEVRFNDYTDVKLEGAITRIKIDHRFIEVCEPGSIRVCSICGDRARSIGAEVDGGTVVIRAAGGQYQSRNATLHLTGVRKGFKGMRFPNRTRKQYVANERFINSAYPKE